MGAYYYAAGRKIALETDRKHVAVDQRAAQRAGLETPEGIRAMAQRPGDLVVAERSALDKKTLANLKKAGALQPVYKRERAVIVALPEVRIEFDNAEQRRAALDFLSRLRSPEHTIGEETDDWIVVRPVSGQGSDALTIANEVYEKVHPAAASVRFLQFVPRPDVSR